MLTLSSFYNYPLGVRCGWVRESSVASMAMTSALRRAWRPASRRLMCTEVSSQVLIASPPAMRVIDLHRPKALNALNSEMIDVLLPLLRDWQQVGGDVKVVVMRGSGERAFCAGGDIRYLHECAAAYSAHGDPSALDGARDFFRREYTLNHTIGTSRIPVVSLVDGIVMGGGVGLSVHGDLRVATERTVFAMPETAIGFFPDVGGTYFLPRLRGSLGMYLGLTGARLRGRDVLTAGVATHYVPSERIEAVEALLLEFASQTVGKAYTLESTKDSVDVDALSAAVRAVDQLDGGQRSANASAAAPELLTARTLAEIDACFGGGRDLHSIIEGVNELAQGPSSAGEDGHGHWAVQAAKDLARASPTSLAVTHEALRRGGQCATLGECLQMEYRLAQRFLRHPDMVSGIGAILSKSSAPVAWAEPPDVTQLEEWFSAGEYELAFEDVALRASKGTEQWS